MGVKTLTRGPVSGRISPEMALVQAWTNLARQLSEWRSRTVLETGTTAELYAIWEQWTDWDSIRWNF